MKREVRWMLFVLSLLLAAALMAACSKEAAEPVREGEDAAPEELGEAKLVMWSQFNFTDDYFNNIFIEPVKQRYPQIELEIIRNTPGAHLDDLVLAGNVPDLVLQSVLNTGILADMDYPENLESYVRKYNFDFDRIEPSVIQFIKESNPAKQLVGLPFTYNFVALYYNKDIFDRFSVDYPVDGMTWDEVIELARRVTRSEEEVDYMGLDPNNIQRLAFAPTKQVYFDRETGRASVNNDAWREAFQLLERIISIPGNRHNTPQLSAHNDVRFVRDRYVAMYGTANLIEQLRQAEDLNWDMVSYPVYREYPGVPALAGARGLYVGKASRYKEHAFQVMNLILSDDVQRAVSRDGEGVPLIDEGIRREFGQNIPQLEGKNTGAIYYYSPSWPSNPTELDQIAGNLMFQKSRELYSGKDINTILREAEELLNLEVEQRKQR